MGETGKQIKAASLSDEEIKSKLQQIIYDKLRESGLRISKQPTVIDKLIKVCNEALEECGMEIKLPGDSKST